MEARGGCMLEAKGWAAMGQAMARALCQAWGRPKARPRSGQAVPRVRSARQAQEIGQARLSASLVHFSTPTYFCSRLVTHSSS